MESRSASWHRAGGHLPKITETDSCGSAKAAERMLLVAQHSWPPDGNQRDNGGPHETRPHTATVLTFRYLRSWRNLAALISTLATTPTSIRPPIIWSSVTSLAGRDTGVMSPKPTVANVVIVK
jgi:hypothetical protein